jgi:hypothetical protein
MKKITPQQKKYVDERAKGQTKVQSAILAGYAPDPTSVPSVEDSKTVQEALAKIRKEVAENADITKEDVVRMLVDAADMAKLMADPTGLVAAARELGKMLGFYAPEVKKVTHGLDKNSLRAVLDEMTDDDLSRIANARAIDGEAKVIAIEAPK